LQDFDEEFYRGFHLIVCGLDSIVARKVIVQILWGEAGGGVINLLPPSKIHKTVAVLKGTISSY
jgi:hypothetical protein